MAKTRSNSVRIVLASALACLAFTTTTTARAAGVQISGTEKVCQLTGDIDWETGKPTAARTLTNAGLDATDLGFPVEHDGRLLLFFGDSWPTGHGDGPNGEIPPDDAVGVTTRTALPDARDCLGLAVHTRAGAGPRHFAPATILGDVKIRQGYFNVPSGGVSVRGALYTFFWTDHCWQPNNLVPNPNDPLRRPAPKGDCPENDLRNSIGRSVIAKSSDEGRTFNRVGPAPLGFVYVTAVNTEGLADLPHDQKRGVFIFGEPRYRASIPYLAWAPVESFEDTRTWRFLAGVETDGTPKWAPAASFHPGPQAQIFQADTPDENNVGEFSVSWIPHLRHWVMLYGGVSVRVAPTPWGPWSKAENVLTPEKTPPCTLLMAANGCPGKRDYWSALHKGSHFEAGGYYAPYILDRYTRAGDGPGASTIYWVLSTWNPYQVTVMRSTIHASAPPPHPNPPTPPAPAPTNQSLDRALKSWQALETRLGDAGPKYPFSFREAPNGNEVATVWSTSQIVLAALDLGMLTGNYERAERAIRPLERYLAPGKGVSGYAPIIDPKPGATRWWDDNGLVSLALMQAAEQTHSSAFAHAAVTNWAFIRHGQYPVGGGVAENEVNPIRGIGSTGTINEVALLRDLVRQPDDPPSRAEDLAFAQQNDEFIKARLRMAGGLYHAAWADLPFLSRFFDTKTGRPCAPGRADEPPLPEAAPPPVNVCTWVPVNVQGLMIGSDLLFYRVTHEDKYLRSAIQTADATLDYYTPPWMWRQAPAFTAQFFRNLLALDAVAPNPRYRAVLAAYLDELWNRGRDPDGFFTREHVGASTLGGALDQASIIQLYALEAWPRDKLALVH